MSSALAMHLDMHLTQHCNMLNMTIMHFMTHGMRYVVCPYPDGVYHSHTLPLSWKIETRKKLAHATYNDAMTSKQGRLAARAQQLMPQFGPLTAEQQAAYDAAMAMLAI